MTEIELPVFDIWVEGYACTGQFAKARYCGRFAGATFKDAVEAYVDTLPDDQKHYYNPKTISFWACRFFDNEIDARKAFG